MSTLYRATQIVILFILISSVVTTAQAQVDARMLRYPDVSETQIAFVYAGDIWVVEKDGGTASRLSSPPGEELLPRFSPDGNQIAFSANYDGNTDVYVIPTTGGEPHRVTHHPGNDRLVDWSPGGDRLLFASRRASGVPRFNQLYLVSDRGGLPVRLPVAYGEFGALSPNGEQLAYTPKDRSFRTWKRYRGGIAPDIWLFDLASLDARNLSSSDANDSHPMWSGDTMYFLSDRGKAKRANIWAVDVTSGAMRQITYFTDFDVSFPAIGPSNIVFQAGGRLYLLDLASERHREVAINLVTDLSTVRQRRVNVSDLIQAAQISPTGKRAVFQARGEIFSVPAEHGVIHNLTRTSGVAERFPVWSPDGEQIAYFSDASGEYELTVRSADGSGEEETLTTLGPGFRYRPWWSPDSEKIAFIDNAQAIQVYEIETGVLREVDRGLWMLHGGLEGFSVSWSSDSRWLAYSRGLETGNNAVFVFDTLSGESTQLTSGYYSDFEPTFDPDGKYLYYFSNRTLEPIYSDIDATWVYPNTTKIVASPLTLETSSPLAPRNDAEEPEEKEDGEVEESESEDEGGKDEDAEKDEDESAPVEIVFNGFEDRAVVLPPEAGNYTGLRAVSGKVVYQRFPRSGSNDEASPVVFFDLEEREEKTILDNASGFEIAAKGKKMLVEVQDSWAIVDLKPGVTLGGPKGSPKLATDRLEMVVDPRSEWKQLFTEVWRTYRDYFYDPNLHGLDWDSLRTHYGSLLDDAVTRWDVNFVIGELIGEVNASHTYVGGGDTENAARKAVGLLGVDWELVDGAYRIARIVRGAPWDAEVRSPLTEPGVKVNEGDFVLAVNGIPLDPGSDPFAPFEGLAEATVSLTVNDTPSTEGAREVLVETLRSEAQLRHREWIEANRQRVLEASDGRIGYIFVPNTAVPGQTELVRQLNSQIRLPGLIIDERFNAGGQLPDRFIEKINRQMVTRIAFRNGATATHPQVTHYGPKAMLINGWAGSGGDAFPFFFKEMNVGPLIGERTWGGLIGPAVGHRLIDGGRYTAPPGRLYGPDGVWFAEGHGVDPDIPVVDHPSAMAKGGDPQLEAAIAEVLRLLELNPPQYPEPPEFEVR
ncbi:MAG: peptidase S41 [bacterium]|nr:peptidase S41 [bacterium]